VAGGGRGDASAVLVFVAWLVVFRDEHFVEPVITAVILLSVSPC
jgi:hypothetical protein